MFLQSASYSGPDQTNSLLLLGGLFEMGYLGGAALVFFGQDADSMAPPTKVKNAPAQAMNMAAPNSYLQKEKTISHFVSLEMEELLCQHDILRNSPCIDWSERVVESTNDVVSVPRAGDKGTQSCGEKKNPSTFQSHFLFAQCPQKNKKKISRHRGYLHPMRMMIPPVKAMRDLRTLSSPPQVVHFIPMVATPIPATEAMMLTIMRARVA